MKQIHTLILLLLVVSFAYAEGNTFALDSIPLDTIQGEEVYKRLTLTTDFRGWQEDKCK